MTPTRRENAVALMLEHASVPVGAFIKKVLEASKLIFIVGLRNMIERVVRGAWALATRKSPRGGDTPYEKL